MKSSSFSHLVEWSTEVFSEQSMWVDLDRRNSRDQIEFLHENQPKRFEIDAKNCSLIHRTNSCPFVDVLSILGVRSNK